MITFKDKLEQYENSVNSALNAALPAENGTRQAAVYNAMRYSLMAGGKRLRPMLTLEFCRMSGGSAEEAMPFALAVEMVHSYSLIHDDLPCMDNDDYRRGKPSCHKQFGEANALLAGDALLTMAFEMIGRAGKLPAEVRSKAASYLAERAGAAGMVGGQVIDLSSEGKPVGKEVLIEMYALKTGALLQAACGLGVLAGGGDETMFELAGQYASAVGMAFQIIDDILDVTGDETVLGKPVGSDAESQKATFVTLFGLDGAKKQAAYYTDEAKKKLEKFPDHEFLMDLTKYLLERDR